MLNIFKESAKNIKNIKVLSVCAILMALSIVLSMYSLYIGNFIKINFGYIGYALVGFMFGPFVSSIFAGVLDVLQYLIKPQGSYFFGFTFNAILSGLIYGIVLYKKKPTLKNVLLARVLIGLIVSVFLGTLWLDIMYGKSFSALLPLRAFKELLLIPIDTIIFHQIIKFLKIPMLKMFNFEQDI